MKPSPRFKELEGRLKELKSTFLPRNFSPTGDYSDKVRDQSRAFRLLSHAELEGYLEDISLDISSRAIKLWETSRKLTRPLLGLVSGVVGQQSGARKIQADEFLDYQIKSAYQQHRARINANNGVKEASFFQLIIALGILENEIPITLIADLNSFGSDRGDTAHKPGKLILQKIDPKSELTRVKNIVAALKELDVSLLNLTKATK
jgi:hypothetical protein